MPTHAIIAQARQQGRTLLTELEAKQILHDLGIATTPGHLATSEEDAVQQAEALGGPAVLKIASPDIVHKSDVGGVKLHVHGAAEVRQAFRAIRDSVAERAPAARIAELVAKAPHLHFAGLQAYHGSAQHAREAGERRDLIARAVELVEETRRALGAAGLEAGVVSGGGTGTYENEAASGVYNELQCGSYVFMDADYARNKRDDGSFFGDYEHALFVYATVMSLPVPERAIVDAGLKAFSTDSGLPLPWKLPGAAYQRPSDEHGVLDLSNCAERLKRGDKVLLVPGHCDPTVNLHDWYVGVRGLGTAQAQVECLWPVAARGAVF